MDTETGTETGTFLSAIQSETHRIQHEPFSQHRGCSYSNRGLYAKQLKYLPKYFDPKQLFIIKYEDFSKNEETTLHQLFDFLGVSHSYEFKHMELNKRAYQTFLTEDEKNYLFKVFEADIIELEHMLDWDCCDWRMVNTEIPLLEKPILSGSY